MSDATAPAENAGLGPKKVLGVFALVMINVAAVMDTI